MPVITFNAFSFLQKKLRKIGVPYSNVKMEIEAGCRAEDVLSRVKLTQDDVEVVFVNGKVSPLNTLLNDGDRVAFVPHGTPGPYRVLLGFKNKRL